MTKTLRLTGVHDRSPLPSELARSYPGEVTVKDAALVHTARAGADSLELPADDEDVVEIELQDGFRIWTRVEDLKRDLAPRTARSGDATAIEIPSSLAVGPVSRAPGAGWALKAVKVLGLGDVEGTIAQFAASHVEGRLTPGPGLYRCAADDATRLSPVRSLEGKGPVLVFLHGTGSSTTGSFSDLWAPRQGAPITSLFDHYEGRVLAYQHRTLSESPIENALALMRELEKLLPPGGDLHIVSHSRGGLIGELLARGMREGAAPFTADDFALFGDGARARDREALEQLSILLQRTAVRVTKFVRVACPARGTTLADRRLDRYLSVLVNLASFIPALRANPVYDGLTSLLAGVLKKRADPEDLPGLEAMMPTSPLVRLLNDPNVKTAADLHVLGGDLAGVGFFGRLKTLATDFYYRDDHDVVVNTPAMLGGTSRMAPIRYWVDTGDQVTHFHYFSRSDTTRRLLSALTGSSADFRTLEARPSAVTSADYVKRAALTRPVVFVLPGIMGSQLSVGESHVWMNLLALARGGMADIALGTAGVKATGLLADGYAALCEHLQGSHEVMPFPYDWRQSLEETAEALRMELDRVLPLAERVNQPVRLLAHSMGGLVVRTMLLTDAGRSTWERLCRHPGARFVMLGTPNRGSFAIPAMLMGRDALVKKLALVDLRSTHAHLLATIAAFDGVLNLLPHDDGADFFDQAHWEALLEADAPETRGLFGSGVESSKSVGFRWALPDAAALAKARALAKQLGTQRLDPARMAYVAGSAPETACDVRIDRDAPRGRRVRVMATRRGDGRVTWDTGIPREVPTFYMDTIHGDMANDRRHFAALVELLDTGRTTRLATTPPIARAADTPFEARDPLPDSIPDEAELVAAALGGRREKVDAGDEAARTHVHVRLVHDNLTNARDPVLVSHYKQDVIVAAEKYLDDQLGGRLSELLQMELYPGPLNTAVVVVNEMTAGDQSVHPGAVVVGLGEVGALTPGALTSTLAHALTLYGSDCVGKERRRQQRLGARQMGGTVSAPITAILIGSGEGGVSLTDSVRALLRATQQANRRLRMSPPQSARGQARLIAQVDRIEIFELYEDRAIEAVYALNALAGSPEFADYHVEPLLARGAEGQRRARYAVDAGWWQRLRIVRKGDGSLEFEAVTRTARIPATLLPTQRGLVNGFVERAVRTTRADARLGETLFELLVPNDLKSFAPDRQKLALMLDPSAAELPWELMQDGFDRMPEPLAVASGLVRQLLVDRQRAQVLRATENTALVVGNPIVRDARFPSLAGAREEAAAVATVLRDVGEYDVQLLLEGAATPSMVLGAIHERPLRILHLAAHGVFDFVHTPGQPPVTGLVLDQGLFFTAAEADQLRYVPELVFINCCFLGRTTADAQPHASYHRLAANLATQFIRMGARAVIAAGWEVDDAAAKTFATSFYTAMLRGTLFGDAVMQARRDTFREHGATNTWGAYQCYGDVSFSLTSGESSQAAQRFVSETELRFWLENFPSRARTAGSAGDRLLQELEERIATAPPAWLRAADLTALAGSAFLSLAQFSRAIEFYDRLLSAETASAPMLALEQFANCRARWAVQLAEDPARHQDALDQLDQAEKLLESLLSIGTTSERSSLLGSVLKRRAQLTPDPVARRAALRRMDEAYGRAFELSTADGSEGDPYPLINQIAAQIVLQWQARQPQHGRETIAARLELLERAARSREGSKTDTFNLLARAERGVLQALLDRELTDAERTRLEDAFASALSRGATARQRDSVRAQFAFFREMATTELKGAARDRLLAQLEALEQVIQA